MKAAPTPAIERIVVNTNVTTAAMAIMKNIAPQTVVVRESAATW
jgi:hypothetical protein